MLDDLQYIHERDQDDALGTAEKQYEQAGYAQDVRVDFTPENIVFAAMGGSALAAQMSMSWPGYTVPFEMVRGYDLPAYVSDKSLVIAASFSGNTEETLSAVAQAEAKGAKIAVITAGGKLQAIAQEKGYPLVLAPKEVPGRYATFYHLKALLSLLQETGVLAEAHAVDMLAAQAEFLKTSAAAWRPDVATVKNQAKQIAQELLGKSVVIYSGPKLFPVAYKWKVGCNENAKQVAWANQLPEFNHNEFSGWSKQPTDKPYAIIELRSNLEHERVQRRFELSTQLLSGMRPAPIVVEIQGASLLEQLLWASLLGDFVSLYLAFLTNTNPTPLPLVDKLKEALNA
jgi:glucose/mannose-6-phosphate isomerase